ncbi:hypothetical protein AX774_g2919 [Zancudomyces culisetae]|uniref:Uncharacterized protein n=1 Tax=Zancudomyces culisetae TaxID=1213189 RepID=A0A1R1PRF9_ZANCU|nr:hypothetical protein AX774_g2919 [Zancudomyces culisetae]|eukprot:OMH83570.1 hypothetical protein AX774_g2919 [Zancudomyces culisetae]
MEEESKKMVLQRRSENKESEQKKKYFNRNPASHGGKNVKDLVKDQKPLGQLIKMFDELSVNLLNKVEEVVDKRIKGVEKSN